MEIEYGDKVVDNQGKPVGKVDYVIRDTYTGEISKFRVNTGKVGEDLFYSTRYIDDSTAGKVTLKFPFEKGNQS